MPTRLLAARLLQVNLNQYEPRSDQERRATFGHLLTTQRVTGNDTTNLTVAATWASVAQVLQRYDANNASHIPVYGITCIAAACRLLSQHLQSLRTGVGHIVIVACDDVSQDVMMEMNAVTAHFAGRIFFLYELRLLGMAEAMNTILRVGFALRPRPPYVMVFEAEVEAKASEHLERFAAMSRKAALCDPRLVVTVFAWFGAIAVHAHAWDSLGGFDEVPYPAFAEDVEYVFRARHLDLHFTAFPGAGEGSTFVKRPVDRPPSFVAALGRWNREAYIWLKWGIQIGNPNVTTPWHEQPLAEHPWRIGAMTTKDSWVVDTAHRRCLRTGSGVTYDCASEACRRTCWYNPEVLRKVLPPAAELPALIVSNDLSSTQPG